MKQNYFHPLLTTSSVSGNFCQLPHAGILRLDFIEVLFSLFFSKVELSDFGNDGGNLVSAWLGGSKMGVLSKDEGGIESSECHI